MGTEKRTSDRTRQAAGANPQHAAVGGSMFAVGAPLLALGGVLTAQDHTTLGVAFLAVGTVLAAAAAGYLGAYVRRTRAAEVTAQDDR